jgi:hypothetical protein
MQTKKPKIVHHLENFVLDGFVVTTPNGQALSAFPPPETVTYDDPDPKNTFTLNWAISQYPQLAFVLSPPRWDHPLLQRLNHTWHALPIKRVVGGWKLAHSVAEQWENLERTLAFVGLETISAAKVLLPLEFRSFPTPKTYEYLRAHCSEGIARSCAMRSCDAFVPLMVLCS